MKGFLLSLLVIILNTFCFLFFGLYFALANRPDFFVGKSMPSYPNSINWKVSASSGFPDGSPGGDISFNTSDRADKVINFYKTQLVKLGWELMGISGPTPKYPSDYAVQFEKRIGLQKYTAVLTTSSQTNRVIIFIKH